MKIFTSLFLQEWFELACFFQNLCSPPPPPPFQECSRGEGKGCRKRETQRTRLLSSLFLLSILQTYEPWWLIKNLVEVKNLIPTNTSANTSADTAFSQHILYVDGTSVVRGWHVSDLCFLNYLLLWMSNLHNWALDRHFPKSGGSILSADISVVCRWCVGQHVGSADMFVGSKSLPLQELPVFLLGFCGNFKQGGRSVI